MLSSASDCAQLQSTMLTAWCHLVLSKTPVVMPDAHLTVADEPTFKAVLARGLLTGDESVCDLKGVSLWIRVQGHTDDGAAACRDSYDHLRTLGSFTISDPDTNDWVTVLLSSP